MKKTAASVIGFFAPALAFAQIIPQSPGLSGILNTVKSFMSAIIPVLITLGIIYFIWGVLEYVLGKSDDAKKEGRNRMIWGIVGLFAIVSVWGLVALLNSTFGIQQGGVLNQQQIPGAF